MPTLLAAAIAFALPFLVGLVMAAATGKIGMLTAEPTIMLSTGAMAAAPFALMRILRERSAGRALAVNVGISILLALWLWYLVDAMQAQNAAGTPEYGGANIGLGIILLFGPVVIFILMLALSFIGRRKPETSVQ